MADYSDLMKLEKKVKQSSPTVPTPFNQVNQEEGSKPANQQAGKQVNMQTSKQTNRQTGKQVNMQTDKHAKPEKYSSYLLGEYKKRLKHIALDTDRKEYEVLQEAIELYLRQRDK